MLEHHASFYGFVLHKLTLVLKHDLSEMYKGLDMI